MTMMRRLGWEETKSNSFHEVTFIFETLSTMTKKQQTGWSASSACRMKSRQKRITASSKSGS